MEAKRINKFISETGFCSRREADRIVEEGRVTVNGEKATLGTKVLSGDTVKVDGKPLNTSSQRVYIAFNKPPGVTCTTDLSDRSNIIDYIGFPERIFPIGRLDKPSEGLIFLTNDGDIVNKILRAGNNHEKEYIVRVNQPVTDHFIKKMSSGVKILGTVTKRCKVTRIDDTSFSIILTQGLNRQIRRMCETLDYQIVTLKRIRVMNITLKGLPKGQWRYFTPNEVETINKLISKSIGTEEASH